MRCVSQTHIQKRTRQHSLHGSLQISILADNRAILPAQLHKARLEVLTAGARDLPTNSCATGEVDLTHGVVFDHGIHDLGGILRGAVDDIQTAGWEAGIFKGAADGPVAAGS